MKIKIDVDELESVTRDFEIVYQDFSEILLSVGNSDLLGIKDETAIFNLRALHQVKNLLSKIEGKIVRAQNQKQCKLK